MIRQSSLVILLSLVLWTCSSGSKTVSQTVEPATDNTLEIITRADWGWVPLTDSIPTHEISYITIHHGGEDFAEDKDVIQYLRGLQAWSQSDKNWIDNPYHYMIDLKGNIYETRPIKYPGDTNTSYDVRGHALICVMGNYENQIVSETQLEQLARLIALLADRYDVSPDHIKTHKDYVETLCPGKDLYQYFEDGSLLERVATLRQ